MPTSFPMLSENRLRDDDGLFHGLLHNGMVGVYVIQGAHFRYVNQRFAELFGYQPEDICGQLGPLDLVIPQDRPRVAATMAQRLHSQAEFAHYSFRGQTRNGQHLDLEVFGIRTTLDGAPAIVGMLVDVTGRCASERAVTEQLNFTAQVIEAIPSPLFFKDEAGRYVGCNKAFEQFIGRQRNELLGRSVFDISPPDLAERYHAADQALFDNPGI
ncbi:MAG: PAS domain-containing protein, partial [Zoogloea sp.]|uniref:PAS domain-containing protein n=1 Tax=Zoogloea sp. TaxID=49181 RepID=UPI003F3BA92F